MATIPKPSTHAGWAPISKDYVGSGSAACLIDRHPFLSLADYAARKITGKEPPPTKAMRRGLTLERAVAELFMEEHGIQVVPATVLYQRGPFVASVDFEPVAFDASWFLETKTSAQYIDEVPPYWAIQAIIQAWCGLRAGVHIGVLDKSMTLKSFYVDATTDEARFLMEQITPAAERFLSYTSEGKIPEGLQLNENAVKALFPRAEQKAMQIDADTLAWVSELADAREIKNAAKKREDAAKDALAAVLVDASAARYGEAEVLTWRNSKDALAFNRELFEQEHPGVLDLMEDPRYKRPVPGARTMRVTKQGKAAADEMPWAAADEAIEEESW